MEKTKKNKTHISNLIMIILVVLSMLFMVLPGDLFTSPVSAAGTSNWYTKSYSMLDNDTAQYLTDYFNNINPEGLGAHDMPSAGFSVTYPFSAGHDYYIVISGHHKFGVLGDTLMFDGVNIWEDYVFSWWIDPPNPEYFRVYVIHINTSHSYSIACSNDDVTWYPVHAVTGDVVNKMMFTYSPLFADGYDQYLAAWLIDDDWLPLLPENALFDSINSHGAGNYVNIDTYADNVVSYLNFTTNTDNYFFGDMYFVLKMDTLDAAPSISTSVDGGDYYDSPRRYNIQIAATTIYIVFYRVHGITINDYAPEDISIMIDNTNFGHDTVYSVNTLRYSNTGFWRLYTQHQGNGVYMGYIDSPYYVHLRLYVYDELGVPLPNMLCTIAGVDNYNLHTNAEGFTDYFVVTMGQVYTITVYDDYNNYNVLSYGVVSSGWITLNIAFVVNPPDTYIVFLNNVFLPPSGFTHQAVRYYYFLDMINVYRLDINKDNVTIFTKDLYSNTGYLDYYFIMNGTYYYNITHITTDALKNSENININNSVVGYGFYPAYTPFLCSKHQIFYYYNNLNFSIILKITDNFYLEVEKDTSGMVNLSFDEEDTYFCEIYYLNISYVASKKSFATYYIEYPAKINIITLFSGSKQIAYRHNFIGEGNTKMRFSSVSSFSTLDDFSPEVSDAQSGSIIVALAGAGNLYYIDLYVNGVEIAVASTYGYGIGNNTTIIIGGPVGINPIFDLSNIILGFGLDITAGYYVVGMIIMMIFAFLFLFMVHNGAAALIGALFGCVICLVCGFLPLWVGVLIGVLCAAFIIFSFSGKLTGGGGG